MPTLLEAALAYADRGWYVFPLEPAITGDAKSGKAPLAGLAPNGKDDATTNPDLIRAWWARCPNANIGISTEPSGLVVLDVDIADGKQGAQSLAELEKIIPLPETLTARTGSGGIHAVFERGDEVARQALHIRPGLDLLGKGYFVAAPSTHHTGGSYSWVRTNGLARIPHELVTLERVRAPSSDVRTPDTTPRAPLPEKSAKIVAASRIASVFPAKGRHMAFLALAGALASEGWPADAIEELSVMVARLIPNSDAKALADRGPQARDSVEKVSRGEQVAGWGTLASFIPEADILASREALGLEVHDFDFAAEPSTTTLGARGSLDLAALGMMVTDANGGEENPAALDPYRPKYIGELAKIKFPPVISYATGIAELDELTGGGISTQQETAILGKPGAGKSALVVSLCKTLESTVPQLYATTELATNEVIARMAAPDLGVAWRDIVRGKAVLADGTLITEEHTARVLAGKRIAVIGQDEIYNAGPKAIELIAKTAGRMAQEHGVAPIIWVDYMQELARGGDDADLKRRVSAVAVAFRQVAQALSCAVGLVCSIGRAGYSQSGTAQLRDVDDPSVYMALAKESGDIDFAAATILFVDVAHEADGLGWKPGRIAVAKSRHGQLGFAGVRFHGATGRWESYADGVKAMSAESQKARSTATRLTELEEKVMAKVRELSMLGENPNGRSNLLGKTALKIAVGGNATLAGVAIDALISTGKLVVMTEQFADGNGLMRKDAVIALPANTDTTPRAPIDIGSVLAGITGIGSA